MKKMKKYRLGVVGLGHRGRDMFKLASLFECVDPVAACDMFEYNWLETKFGQDKPMCEQFPQTRFYTDFQKMLDEAALDILLVETGADVHAAFCAEGLKRNIHVMSDIPVVATVEEAEMLWAVHKKSKGMFMTGANPNEARYTVVLRDLYERGFLGEPYYMEAEYIHWSMPGSVTSKALNENGNWRRLLCPIRYCTHSLGPLLTILKEDLRYVSCFGTGAHGPDEDYVIKKDDMSCAQFRTESGVVVRLLRNGRCRAKIGAHSYRVFCTEGYFERIDGKGSVPATIRYNSTRYCPADALVEQPGPVMPFEYAGDPQALKGGHGGMDYALFDHFFKALEKGLPSPISLKEGLRMTLPGIYAEMSSKRDGEVIRIRYPWDND